MAKLFDVFKKILGGNGRPSSHTHEQRHRDPEFVGRSSTKEIEQTSPERVGELVGHPVERVET